MEFALFYEIQVPRPWWPGQEAEAYQAVLDAAILGDQYGFHSIWTVEHHFFEEISHCSAPDALYGAIAARTENIRIGHGVRLLPFPYNHPVRAAEAAAVVDLVSKGRLEFGTGRSGSRIEMEGFGIDPHQTRAMWEESLDLIVKAWTDDVLEWDGKYFKVPPRRVLPRPVQDPHPPLWGATASVDGHELIGEKGLGLLSFNLAVPVDDLYARLERYRTGLARANPVGKFVNGRSATLALTHCAETNDEAESDAGDACLWYIEGISKSAQGLVQWMDELKEDLGDYGYRRDYMKLAQQNLEQRTFARLRGSKSVLVGNPDEIIEVAKAYEATGVDLLLCLVQMKDIPHHKVLKSIELMGKHVLPAFR